MVSVRRVGGGGAQCLYGRSSAQIQRTVLLRGPAAEGSAVHAFALDDPPYRFEQLGLIVLVVDQHRHGLHPC